MENIDRLSQDEYENQYYEFSSSDLLEKFNDVVKRTIQLALSNVENSLEAITGSETIQKDLLRSKIDQLYGFYMESAKKALCKFEKEARSTFAIPPNVLLDEDKFKVETASEEEISNLKSDIEELEKTLIQEKMFLAKCNQMKETYQNNINPIYKKVSGVLKIAKNNLKDSSSPHDAKLREVYYTKVEQFTGTKHNNVKKHDFFD
ncbi:uncharacterized protein LOC114334044 [Diabrotica virgifera virgifera]|uniref:Protein MIS12 homolog n=1 Tax=Diabrotica virgifera virgifera TaxID=50390 RepID=A0ABM5IRP2_DIAVI|nr:uncharacterized protein LOC114334044 [Diabrotica virgifera virgifera]